MYGRGVGTVRDFRELRVYRAAFGCAVEIYGSTRAFGPRDRDLATQLRRTSTSIAANIPEAWAKRRYPKNFMSVLTIAEGECNEMAFWLDFAAAVGCLTAEHARDFDTRYRAIGTQLAAMRHQAVQWKPRET